MLYFQLYYAKIFHGDKCMNNAVFIDFKDSQAKLGQSKFFGNPDLPDSFDWPTDEDDYDMDFICQINCADASKYNNLLPKEGMLYFFGCIASPLGIPDAPEITVGFQSVDNFSVIYNKTPVNDLLSGEIVDENGEPVGFSELVIDFSDKEIPDSKAFHQLLGEYPDDSGELDDYCLLFCLDSFSGDDFTLEFEDSGYLYFLIKKYDLKNKDFSKTICYLSV